MSSAVVEAMLLYSASAELLDSCLLLSFPSNEGVSQKNAIACEGPSSHQTGSPICISETCQLEVRLRLLHLFDDREGQSLGSSPTQISQHMFGSLHMRNFGSRYILTEMLNYIG